eukprot:331560-Amphidinium_carterae.1
MRLDILQCLGMTSVRMVHCHRGSELLKLLKLRLAMLEKSLWPLQMTLTEVVTSLMSHNNYEISEKIEGAELVPICPADPSPLTPSSVCQPKRRSSSNISP